MNNAIVEYINGIEVIKTFNQSENSYKKYSDAVYDNALFPSSAEGDEDPAARPNRFRQRRRD